MSSETTDKDITMKKNFELLKYQVYQTISKYELNADAIEVDLNKHIEALAHELTLRLTFHLLRGEETLILPPEEIEIPADWWQAVRERWLPAFWLRRFPLRTRSIVTNKRVTRVCPHPAAAPSRIHFNFLNQKAEVTYEP